VTRASIAAAALVLAAACGKQPSPMLPDPQILSIEPNQMISSGTADASITVDAILPFDVNYDQNKANVDRLVLIGIGPLQIDSPYENHGILNVFIPSKLQPAVYNVSLIIVTDARTATLPGAFTVNPGVWPDSYTVTVDQPGDKTPGVPFGITIRAFRGSVPATDFEGTVYLSIARNVNRGTLTPSITGKFSAGVRQENVVSSQIPGMGLSTITATDLEGHTGTSTMFNVN
jgi:hypothetical protein